MEEESWRRNLGRVIHTSGRHLEASGRHLGGIWEASGETREAPGGSLGLEAPGGYWKQKVAHLDLKSKKFPATSI